MQKTYKINSYNYFMEGMPSERISKLIERPARIQFGKCWLPVNLLPITIEDRFVVFVFPNPNDSSSEVYILKISDDMDRASINLCGGSLFKGSNFDHFGYDSIFKQLKSGGYRSLDSPRGYEDLDFLGVPVSPLDISYINWKLTVGDRL